MARNTHQAFPPTSTIVTTATIVVISRIIRVHSRRQHAQLRRHGGSYSGKWRGSNFCSYASWVSTKLNVSYSVRVCAVYVRARACVPVRVCTLAKFDSAYPDNDVCVCVCIQQPSCPRSCLFYRGSVVHGGGANMTHTPRLGVILEYAAGWLRPQENHCLAVPPHAIKSLYVAVAYIQEPNSHATLPHAHTRLCALI